MSKKKYPWPVKRGMPLPLGVTVLNEGINFAFFSRHGTHVVLVIDFPHDKGSPPVRHELSLSPDEHKTGDIWHILLATTDCDFSYGYRVFGPSEPTPAGTVFTPERILLDPYCHALTPRRWGESSRYGTAPCCRIISHDFDWQNDKPLKTPLAETVIYELHVRGFSALKKGGSATPGTYASLMEQIPYLQELGISAVELMPVTEFDENDNVFEDPQTGQALKNFWGYNPVSFFSLKSGYAHNPADHVNEFKRMVRELHKAGIEVILDIVYNHTGEGGYDGTTSSFRGIDNPIYYLLDPFDQHYLNFSGCGNTLNCNHPVVRSLIRESLRYWVTEMHIDGFRFDLASILGRDSDGSVLSNPPMVELIAEDPVLRDTKIIAEAWDAAGLYQVGSFSSNSRWGEWNGRFRDDIRAFSAGHSDMVRKLATRIAGSSDLYQSSSRTPLSSINLVTSHDGFTLYDLVSYNTKHNLNNGENNRDGDNHNISWNSGHEGTPAPGKVELIRQRRIRSMVTILMLSQGVPMLTAGDEFARSQGGNNNAWCQDNETSWLDWRLTKENSSLLRFFRMLIALRRVHPVFRREDFFCRMEEKENEISWQYLTPGEQNWSSDVHGLGVLLHGERQESPRDDDFFIMLNGSGHQTLKFTPPPVPANSEGRSWFLIIDTSAPSPHDFMQPEKTAVQQTDRPIDVPPYGVTVLQSIKEDSRDESSSH